MGLISRFIASFDAIKPVPDLVKLDNEFNQLVGTNGILNGGSTSNRQLTKYNHATEPVLELDQLGAGLIAQFKQNGVEKARIENDGDLVSNGITTAAGVVTFGSIPVGPASDPTTTNQLTRKAYVDARRAAWSISFGVADPSAPTVGQVISGMVSYLTPTGSNITITKINVKYEGGSHTSGGSVTFAVQRRVASDNYVTPTTLGTATLDNTNNTKFQVYTNDLADVPLTTDDTLIVFISARSGTVTERDVSIIVQGTQQVF